MIARAIGGVPEVAGDAALLLADGDGESVAAELLALAVGDGELRAELRERGAARVAAYAPQRTAQHPARRARVARRLIRRRSVPHARIGCGHARLLFWHMTSPRVTELPRRLEPVGRDTFLGAG